MQKKQISLNINCVEYMKSTPSNFFDLAIVDPPYGLGDRLSDGGGKLKNTPMAKLYRDSDKWDILPEKEYWSELFRVSKNQIVCGANYFMEYLNSSRGIVCWDKKQHMPTLSSWEFIWTSFDKVAKTFYCRSTDLDRFHPTQKPIDLYVFLLKNFAKEGDIILDTHLGSGSSRIACHYLNFEFVGCEINKDYFEKSNKRFESHTLNNTLFEEFTLQD